MTLPDDRFALNHDVAMDVPTWVDNDTGKSSSETEKEILLGGIVSYASRSRRWRIRITACGWVDVWARRFAYDKTLDDNIVIEHYVGGFAPDDLAKIARLSAAATTLAIGR